jgi:hypothetical protein
MTAIPQPAPAATAPSARAARAVLPALVFLCALFAYLRTMSPTFGWGDSSELITAAYRSGIAHSPGYPTWLLLAYPFAHLPLPDVAFRLNLMNALLGAGAIVLLYRLCHMISGSRAAGLVAALSFAFTITFWDLTTEADVFTLHLCFAVLIMLIALKWRAEVSTRPANRWLWLLWALVGVSLGNHPLTALMIPALIYLMVATCGWRILVQRRTLWLVACLALGLSVYLLLPLRAAANPPPHPSNPRTLAALWSHVTAASARRHMFDRGWSVPLGRAAMNLRRLPREFGLAGCALAAVGIPVLWRRNRALLWFFAIIAALDVLYACNISVIDAYAYYVPLHLVLAVLLSLGAAGLLAFVTRTMPPRLNSLLPLTPQVRRALAAAALLAIPAVLFGDHLAAVDRSDDLSPELFARAAFTQAEPHALLLADWWSIGPLWYLRYVEGQRSDLVLSPAPSVSTEARFAALTSKESLSRSPAVYYVEHITSRAKLLKARGFYLVPEGPLFRLLTERPSPGQVLAHVPAASIVRVSAHLGLVKVQTDGKELHPGSSLLVTLYWTPLPGYRGEGYDIALDLTNEQTGSVWHERVPVGHDLYPLREWRSGMVLKEPHHIYLAEPAPIGTYDLLVRARPRGQGAKEEQPPTPAHETGHRVARIHVKGAAALPPRWRPGAALAHLLP